MARRFEPLNLSDFTGGLNLRADAFKLAENESPEMLNVEIEDRGGVRSRLAWREWNAADVAGTWAPQRLHVYVQADGATDVILVKNGEVWTSSAGVFSQLSDASGVVVADSDVIGADPADWGPHVYLACGKTQQARKWTGGGNAARLTANGPTWQNDYVAPTGGYMPKAEYICQYQGYMVAAHTSEDGTDYPNRVRISHPNSPEDWREDDFIDLEAGGSRITGIVAFSDHLVIFKTNSVWTMWGNDAESFTPSNLTMQLGAIHRNAIVQGPSSVFFYSHPDGVFEYQPDSGIREISLPIRPILDNKELNDTALDKINLGFLRRRLWWSVPYEKGTVTSENRGVFVFDPPLDSWTFFRDPEGYGLGPFATGGIQGDGALLLAAHPVHEQVVEVEVADGSATDTINGVTAGYETVYATMWAHNGWPSLKKSWRRPDYVVTEQDAAHTLTVAVMRDYEEANPRSTHTIDVETGSDGGVWGEFVWGTDAWGGAPEGSHIERGGLIGLAKSVQLRFSGEVGKPWGLNTIIHKFRPRRFR